MLKEVQKRRNLTYVFITHDLTSVTYFCDEVIFLYQGGIVETATVAKMGEVKHSYAQKLLASVMDMAEEEKLAEEDKAIWEQAV